MTHQGKKFKIVHPGYTTSGTFNHSMDYVFSEDMEKWQRKKPVYVKKSEVIHNSTKSEFGGINRVFEVCKTELK